MKRTYVGIDPGTNGGIVLLTKTTIRLYRMPPTEKDVWEIVRRIPGRPTAVIEKSQAMPKQGVSSAFKYGQGYGFLRGCLIARGIPFSEVTPQRWMKGLGIRSRRKTESKTQWKNFLKGIVQQKYPQEKITLQTCDAVLIAEYCRQTVY